MTPSRFDRFLPLAGVLAGLTFTAFNVMTWGAPETTSAHDVTVWGAAHETRAQIGAMLLAYTAVLLAFFAAGRQEGRPLRRAGRVHLQQRGVRRRRDDGRDGRVLGDPDHGPAVRGQG